MKDVSAAYKAAMLEGCRPQGHCRITFSNVDVDAASDGTWTASDGGTEWSELTTLDRAFLYETNVATMELNRWILDSDVYFRSAGESIHDGYVSSEIAASDGYFARRPKLTRLFNDPHTFQGVTLTFDGRNEEWPAELTVSFIKGGVAEETVTVYPDSYIYFVRTSLLDVEGIEITFIRALPYHRARLQNVEYGTEVVFTNDDLTNVVQSTDIDPLSRRLPTETLEFTVIDYQNRYDPDNPKGEYVYVDINSPVEIEYGLTLPGGSIEWLKADKYLLDGKPSVKRHLATFTATGLIGRLTGVYYKSKVGRKNLYDMAVDVLADAGLPLTERGANPWDVDLSLKTMYTTAVLPIATHMNCLQLIAHAARCRMYTDDDNVIHVEPFGVTMQGLFSGTWTDNGHTDYSDWESVDDGHEPGSSLLTAELNRRLLDDAKQSLVTERTTGAGYVSSYVANAQGHFTQAIPLIHRSFDVARDIPVMTLRFGMSGSDFPTDISVYYYRVNTLLDTQHISGIHSDEITVTSEKAKRVTGITILFRRALPYRRARLRKAWFRETDFKIRLVDMTGDDYQSINKIDQLKAVQVSKYAYTAEDIGGEGLHFVDGDLF